MPATNEGVVLGPGPNTGKGPIVAACVFLTRTGEVGAVAFNFGRGASRFRRWSDPPYAEVWATDPKVAQRLVADLDAGVLTLAEAADRALASPPQDRPGVPWARAA